MAKSIRDIPVKKKRGPPSSGGRKPPQLVRMDDALTSAIDRWKSKQDDHPSRPEAIRRLVEIGLAADRPAGRTSTKTAARAAELAGAAIDKASDPTASAEERTTRKRRILKGPSMARSIRKD